MSSSSVPITVSVVVATYNRAKYIGCALDSLLAQTLPAEEIVVVDDGSTDNTAEVIAAYGERVTYLRQDNHGKSHALNNAIPKTRGSHLLLFDDDDVLLPEALAAHVEFLTTHPDIDYSHSRSVAIRGDENIWNRDLWLPEGYVDCAPNELLHHVMDRAYTLLQGMLIPRRCLNFVGPFDEERLRAQDYDMVLRLARYFRGGHLAATTFVLRNHRGHRGPATAIHTESERGNVWRHHDREIFRAVYHSHRLAEYLVDCDSEIADEYLDSGQAALALLRRCEVMFQHGLFAEGSHDIHQLLGMPDTVSMRTIEAAVAKAANINDPLYMDDAPVLARQLLYSAGHSGRPAPLAPLLRSLYWTLRRALRQRRWHQFFRVSQALFLSAGHRAANTLVRRSAGSSASR